ncbi:MAG: metallophosphoesterase family protein [Verrucomicrobiota bacterium]|nr:metallophosphoesterase family protein [Verrucomicrobiota bacterium]
MKIGLISDTHDRMDQRIHEIFQRVDHIIHAGDVCDSDIIEELGVIAPTTVVLGNNDDYLKAPQYSVPVFCGIRFLVIHILDSHLAKIQIAESKPDIVIYGHTHVPRDEKVNGIRFINPGSVFRGRQGALRSVAVLELGKTIQNLEFFTL